MLGLAVPELSMPYFSELAEFVIAEARRRSYTVVIEQTDGDPARERQLLKQNERGPTRRTSRAWRWPGCSTG
jgi:DNA-binding LacI/PurR family transcriptional regulator